MAEITFSLPHWSLDPDDIRHETLTMKRGQLRRLAYPNIIIETLRALDGQPTRDQLQVFSKIRRKRFIQVLKHLLDTGSVVRSGSGTKFDPYRYHLGEKELKQFY